jgi:hypothetical protein
VANKNRRNEAKKYLKTERLCENNRNEAKKLLKTEDIASTEGANYAGFARKLVQNRARKEQKQRILRKRTEGLNRNARRGK